MNLIIILCGVYHIGLTFGARILAIHGTDLPSHFKLFSAVIDTLAPHHKITFLADEQFQYEHENVSFGTLDAPNRFSDVKMNACLDSFELFYKNVLIVNESFFESIYSKKNAQNLLNSNATYDLLLILGYGTDQFYQFAHRFKIPMVQVTVSVPFPWHGEIMGNMYSWINDVSFMISEDTTRTIFGRINKFTKNIMSLYRYYWHQIPIMNKVTKKFFPKGTPSIAEINSRTSLMLVNIQRTMGYVTTNSPAVVEIGGLHIKPPKPIPDDLEEFISGAGEHGFIYFSLGTFVQQSVVTENIRKAIVNVFRKLPQRVLWKWNNDMPDAPPNVKIAKWFPQQDILAHKNIKLFILQGGMLSIQEAMYNGVPVLVMPLIFDQFTNAYVVKRKGVGLSESLCRFRENQFYENIKELLYNPRYSINAKQLSKIVRLEMANLPEKLNWWINFVIEHKNPTVLHPIVDNGFLKSIPCDIVLFITFISVIAGFILYYLLVYTYICLKLFKANFQVKHKKS